MARPDPRDLRNDLLSFSGKRNTGEEGQKALLNWIGEQATQGRLGNGKAGRSTASRNQNVGKSVGGLWQGGTGARRSSEMTGQSGERKYY